jgi:hypothetical protein
MFGYDNVKVSLTKNLSVKKTSGAYSKGKINSNREYSKIPKSF